MNDTIIETLRANIVTAIHFSRASEAEAWAAALKDYMTAKAISFDKHKLDESFERI